MSEYKEPPMLDPEDPQDCLYGIPGLHGGALYSVPMYMVEPNPNNPRKNFDQEELEKLAQSIREVGILQPLVLTKQADCAYRIVAGERRWRAAKLAGLGSVPAIILKLTPEQEAEIMLIENLQRQDLDPIEEARAYQALLTGHGYTQETLGEKLGVSQAHIANRIRLLELPADIQENISRGIIGPGHAKELLACKKVAKVAPDVIEKVAKKAAEEGMTVKQVSDAVAREMWDASMPLTKGEWPEPFFDTSSVCEKCKKKTMLKHPYNRGEKLRCLDKVCWEASQKEARGKAEEEREKELLAKYPDAMTVTHQDDFFKQLYDQMEDYCKTKNCNYLRKARYRGAGWVMNVCLNPDNPESYEACREEASQKQQREREEKEASARTEIEQLVNQKIEDMDIYAPRDALIYIAAALLGGFEYTEANVDVFEYLEGVAGKLPEEWEDGGPCDALGWPHLLPILEGLSELQLIRIIFEWPALALGMEPAGMVEWFLKGVPEPEESAPKIGKRVGWILNNSCGDINYNTSIPLLTDDELIHCLRHEKRSTGLRKLMAEAKRREISPAIAFLEEEEEEDADPDGHGTCRVCGCTDDMACEGGCYWVEPDLCSRCAGENT